MTSSSTSVMDDEKFEQIVSEHSSFVYNVAYRMMGNPDDADEVVQDTFLSAYRARDRFRGDAQENYCPCIAGRAPILMGSGQQRN